MSTYIGTYESIDGFIECKSLLQLQQKLQKCGGYEVDTEQPSFKEYETAGIIEYNFLGRNTAQYYFSAKDYSWHKTEIKQTNFMSWQNAKQPFKAIAQWFLSITGYTQEQSERIKKDIQQYKISQLGR